MISRTSIRVAALCFAIAWPFTAHAQEVSISGTITDATDAALPGVTVTALHVDTGNTFAGVTDTAGQYRIGAMRPGMYRITAELAGFVSSRRENLELLVGQSALINFKLTIASVNESITVTGAAPLVDVTQSKLGGNVDSRQVQELPVNGRNWMVLTMLTPGSRVNSVTDSPTLATSAGSFQLNLDGQQVTQLIAQTGYGQPRFSRDAMAEFQFVTSRFDATQGRSSGAAVNAVTSLSGSCRSTQATLEHTLAPMNQPRTIEAQLSPSGSYCCQCDRSGRHLQQWIEAV